MELHTDSSKIDANEVKKILYKTKVNAKFSHYLSGNLYYTVDLLTETYQFPISTIDEIPEGDYKHFEDKTLVGLSTDLGQTIFSAEIKGSELNRWIAKSIAAESFIRIK